MLMKLDLAEIFLVIILHGKIIPGNVTLHSLENLRNTYWKRELRGLTNRKNPNLEKPGGRVALPKLAPHAKCEKSCDIGQQENKLCKCNCVCLRGEGI